MVEETHLGNAAMILGSKIKKAESTGFGGWDASDSSEAVNTVTTSIVLNAR